jgi:hypothetical protein
MLLSDILQLLQSFLEDEVAFAKARAVLVFSFVLGREEEGCLAVKLK